MNTDPMSTGTVPRKIGRYHVDGVLGRGAMGVVYKAHDPKIDRVVAVKTIHPTLLQTPDGADLRQRFWREAQAAARCLHANIVAVFDCDEQDGLPYIVMEYVQGRELQDFLRYTPRVDAETTVSIVGQMLAGLGFAHANGVVHRDLKPANVILLEGGRVKVADFGVARLDTTSFTQHGAVLGSPGFMAPEQFTGTGVDHRTDIFATGIVLYLMLTGQRPFPGERTTEVMYKILHHDPIDVCLLNAQLPARLSPVVRQALAREPADRFQSAEAFARSLREALSGGSVPPEPVPPPAGSEDTSGTVVLGAEAGPETAPASSATAFSESERVLLAQVEKDLAFHVGPLARVLVAKAAPLATNTDQLYEALAGHIPNSAERDAFLKRRPRMRGELTGGSRGTTTQIRAKFTDADLEKAQRALTRYVGPIAKVLVRNAAKGAVSLADLHESLAANVPEGRDRAAFLADVTGSG